MGRGIWCRVLFIDGRRVRVAAGGWAVWVVLCPGCGVAAYGYILLRGAFHFTRGCVNAT